MSNGCRDNVDYEIDIKAGNRDQLLNKVPLVGLDQSNLTQIQTILDLSLFLKKEREEIFSRKLSTTLYYFHWPNEICL